MTNRAPRIDSESGQPLRFPGAPDWDLDVANVAVNPSLSHHSVRAWDLPRTSRSGTTARLSRSRSPQGANFSAFPGAVLVILQRGWLVATLIRVVVSAGVGGALGLSGCVDVADLRRRPGAAQGGRRAPPRGCGQQAPSGTLSIGPIPRLAEDQDASLACGEPGAMAPI